MKKLALTIAIVLGMGISMVAQEEYYYNNKRESEKNGGLFGLGFNFFDRDENFALLPEIFEYDEEVDRYSNNDVRFRREGLFGLGGLGFFNNRYNRGNPGLPGFGSEDNEVAPLGSGIAVLLGLGGAYLVAKKRKDE